MSAFWAAVVGSLGGTASTVGIGGVALWLSKNWILTQLTEPIKAKFANELAVLQGRIQKHNSEELKRFDKLLERQSEDEDTAQAIEQLEYPVLHEAERIIRRIEEVMKGEFLSMYSRPWQATSLTLDALDGNKSVTAVYRLMRLFGLYALYLERSAGLRRHPLRGRLRFYMENKIDPIFASGQMFGSTIMLRDMILEMSECMLNKSEKWNAVTVLSFAEWIESCKASTSVVSLVAARLSTLFTKANPRLAILGIYLIDLRQDMLKTQRYEKSRSFYLDWLQRKTDPNHISIWGLTQDKKTDLSVMNIDAGRIPRNFRSPFYDVGTNPMEYVLPTQAVLKRSTEG